MRPILRAASARLVVGHVDPEQAADLLTTVESRTMPVTQRICNLVPSRGTERDWGLPDALDAGLLAAAVAPPTSVDLRQAWWTIGDQEDTGSCVGWAVAEGVMRYHFVTDAGRAASDLGLWIASHPTAAPSGTRTARPRRSPTRGGG